MNIFERASRNKIRFTSGRGLLSTEDLWDLNLQSLDNIAKEVYKKLKDEGEISFIDEKSDVNLELNLKLDLVKFVIQDKKQRAAAAAKGLETKAKIQELKELLEEKNKLDLMNKSREEIEAMLKELQSV